MSMRVLDIAVNENVEPIVPVMPRVVRRCARVRDTRLASREEHDHPNLTLRRAARA
jgi:hypothetical protein